MIALAAPAGPLGSLEEVLQSLVVIAFFVVPIIRSVLQSKKKAAERSAKQREAQRSLQTTDDDSQRERSGRSAWEELMRGETPTSPAPPPPRVPERAPPPVEPVATTAAATVASRDAEPRAGQDELVLSEMPSHDAPTEEVATAQQSLESDSPWEAMRQAEVAADAQPMAATASLGALRTQLDEAVVLEEREFPSTRMALQATELRRAIVIAEVLSPPLALRRVPTCPGAAF